MLMRCYRNFCFYSLAYSKIGFLIYHFAERYRTYQQCCEDLLYLSQHAVLGFPCLCTKLHAPWGSSPPMAYTGPDTKEALINHCKIEPVILNWHRWSSGTFQQLWVTDLVVSPLYRSVRLTTPVDSAMCALQKLSSWSQINILPWFEIFSPLKAYFLCSLYEITGLVGQILSERN